MKFLKNKCTRACGVLNTDDMIVKDIIKGFDFTLIQEGPGPVSNPNDAWSCVPLAGSVSELFYCKYCLGRLGRNCLVFTSLAACSYVNT